jgi:hypothetical protein
MLSALFHGPGKDKGASYFHPDHGLVDYITRNVKGPSWLANDMQFVKTTDAAAPPSTCTAPVATTGTQSLVVKKPGEIASGAQLIKWNPSNVHQWHADDVLRVDMTRDPEYVRVMRMFHGTVWRHRCENYHPINQGITRWWCYLTVPALCYMAYTIGTTPCAR